jgi:hypothetical protein
MPLDHRLQILLDEQRYQKLARHARRRHTSIAAVIREAIDSFADEEQRRNEALDAILNAPPFEVPEDPADLRRELDEMHARRFE